MATRIGVLSVILLTCAAGLGAPPPSSRPAELKLDLGKGAEMRFELIPAGEFTMGSPSEEKDRS